HPYYSFDFTRNIHKVEIAGTGQANFSFMVSAVSPFEHASTPANCGVGTARTIIDTSNLDFFSRQLLVNTSANIKDKKSDKIQYSVNPVLSKYIEYNIKHYIDSLAKSSIANGPGDYFEMSVCLLNMATGEVIAAPFFNNAFDKNYVDELTGMKNLNFVI